MDLSGKLIIKVKLGDDIRRIPIHNEDITYDELILMMQRVFRGKLNSTDEITVKHRDEDGDLITIFDSSDLSFAIQFSRILKLTLYVNGQPQALEHDEVMEIKRELRTIRDTANTLLDRLDSQTQDMDIGSTSRGPVDGEAVTDKKKPAPRQISVTSSKEFDPLSKLKSPEDGAQNKVMSSFGLSSDQGSMQDRAGTPDSMSSHGSSSSNRQRQQQGFAQPLAPQQQPSAPGPASGSPGQPDRPGGGPPGGQYQQGQQFQGQQGQQHPQGYGGNFNQQFGGQGGQEGRGGFPHQPPQPPQQQQPQQQQQPGNFVYGSPQGGGPGQPGQAGQAGQGYQNFQQQQTYSAYSQQQPGGGPSPRPPGESNPYRGPGAGYNAGYPRPAGTYQAYR